MSLYSFTETTVKLLYLIFLMPPLFVFLWIRWMQSVLQGCVQFTADKHHRHYPMSPRPEHVMHCALTCSLCLSHQTPPDWEFHLTVLHFSHSQAWRMFHFCLKPASSECYMHVSVVSVSCSFAVVWTLWLYLLFYETVSQDIGVIDKVICRSS